MTDLIKEFFITKDFTIFIVFLIVFILYYLKNKIFSKFVQWIIKRTPTKLDNDLFPLIDQLINLILFGAGLFKVLIYLGIKTETLLTISGAGTLALGLALKDTLSNIVAGFVIIIDKPFIIGDRIKLPTGEEVTVHEIGLRRSEFIYEELIGVYNISIKKSILIMNNIDLIKNKIQNYTMITRKKDN